MDIRIATSEPRNETVKNWPGAAVKRARLTTGGIAFLAMSSGRGIARVESARRCDDFAHPHSATVPRWSTSVRPEGGSPTTTGNRALWATEILSRPYF